ncbi:hypothetical protein D3C86_1724410 [compost metagenome]
MPPTITRPICRRLSAPAPLPSTSGSAPSTVAAVVIRIGRRRSTEASRIAVRNSSPSRSNWLAKATMRMPCLVMMPIRVTRPTCE